MSSTTASTLAVAPALNRNRRGSTWARSGHAEIRCWASGLQGLELPDQDTQRRWATHRSNAEPWEPDPVAMSLLSSPRCRRRHGSRAGRGPAGTRRRAGGPVHGRRRSSRDPRIGYGASCWLAPGCASVSWSNLEADAVVQIGANHWLRIPTLDHSLRLSPATSPTTPTSSAQTYTDSYSYSASATANSHSANPSRDQRQRPDKTPA